MYLASIPAGLAALTSLAPAVEASPLSQGDSPASAPTETPIPAEPAPPIPTQTPPPAPPTPTPTATPMTGQPARPMPAVPGSAAPGFTGATTSVTRENVLTTLRLSHPRLLLLAEDEARIRRGLTSDVAARSYRDALVRNGARILTQPTPERVLIGPRLLTVSRTILERVTTLALLYRLDGDPRWAQRARAELLAAAGFSDWNPAHFLDVAEMCHAFAIGYDWLYSFLTPDERTTIRQAIIEKGLRPTEQQYASRASWTRATHNWNLVCNGGAIIGALAIADEEPGLAGTLLAQALASLPTALATYAPDGAWPEGPAYWEYGTLYLVSALAALTSALGTDFGLSDAPGLAVTGRFRLHITGPTGLFFNFADAGPRAGDSPVLFWLARRYDDPVLVAGAREAAIGRASARDLLWYDAPASVPSLATLPLDARYQAAQLALFRSAWADKDAIYVGFKGGDNATNHAHLDLGTFVLDALGQRWAQDLGPDDYDLPGYFGAERWTYERLRTSGQNTLMLNNANQDEKATAPLTAYHSGPDGGFAIAELTDAYAGDGATRVQRGISLRDSRSRVLIQDEIDASQAVDVTWTMHTQAAVELQDARAILSQGGATLEARILAPEGATFSLEDVEFPPPQQPSTNLRRLLVRLPEVTTTKLAVLFTPRRGVTSAGNAVGTPGAPTSPLAATPTPRPIPADTLPLPEIVDLSRWAVADGPVVDDSTET
ncbi:MAG: heparinase II/III family protein [Chloroflexota bacterium]